MKFHIYVNGFFKEVIFSLITLTIFMFLGCGRTYIVFLFHQLDLPNSPITIDDEQKSWIASSLGILSPVACVFSGTLMDFFGRKLYFIVMFIPQIISWIVIALATSYQMLFYGMLIQGIGLGMGFCASTYIVEIASSSNRGMFLGLIPVSYNLGALLCNSLMYFVAWNIAAWIFAGSSLLLTICTFILPESPVWLYSKGKMDKSIQTLCSLRCKDNDGVKSEIDDMEKSCAGKPKLSVITMIRSAIGAWKALLVVVVLQCLMQHTGYAIIFSYTILIFDRLKLPLDSSKFAITYAMFGAVGSIAAPYLMHNTKRRTLLATSSFVMAICMVIVAIYEEIFYNSDTKEFPYIVSMSFYVYALACNAGMIFIAYGAGSEIFPHEVRGIMNGFYGAFSYIYWSVAMKCYLTFMNIFHIEVILWSFGVFCVVITLYGLFILPETKGMTLNEVQEKYFRKKKQTCDNQLA